VYFTRLCAQLSVNDVSEMREVFARLSTAPTKKLRPALGGLLSAH
jgi:hypothetical protein